MEILYIILGWLFGLLTSPISLRIERRYKRKDLQSAISSELKNLAVRLAGMSYKIHTHQETMDKTNLSWVKKIYDMYDSKMVTENMVKILEIPDENFQALMRTQRAQTGGSLGLKTYSLPVLDASLEDISIFDLKFQKNILEMRTQVDFLNQEIENCMRYFFLTFDPTSMGTNKNILELNIKNCHKQILDKSKYIADKIMQIIDK